MNSEKLDYNDGFINESNNPLLLKIGSNIQSSHLCAWFDILYKSGKRFPFHLVNQLDLQM